MTAGEDAEIQPKPLPYILIHTSLPPLPMPKRLLLLLAPLALLGCRKDVDTFFNKLVPPPPPVTLPAETQSGANTFGCLVNGQVWEAKNGPTSIVGNAYSPNARYSRREISVTAFWRSESGGPVTSFSFTAPRVVGPGVYPLGGVGQPLGMAYLESLPYPSGRPYITDATHLGTLTITRLDTAGRRPFVAGRFEFRAGARSNPGGNVPPPTPVEVVITSGRFDVELNRP